jgi:hypothetical protein
MQVNQETTRGGKNILGQDHHHTRYSLACIQRETLGRRMIRKKIENKPSGVFEF